MGDEQVGGVEDGQIADLDQEQRRALVHDGPDAPAAPQRERWPGNHPMPARHQPQRHQRRTGHLRERARQCELGQGDVVAAHGKQAGDGCHSGEGGGGRGAISLLQAGANRAHPVQRERSRESQAADEDDGAGLGPKPGLVRQPQHRERPWVAPEPERRQSQRKGEQREGEGRGRDVAARRRPVLGGAGRRNGLNQAGTDAHVGQSGPGNQRACREPQAIALGTGDADGKRDDEKPKAKDGGRRGHRGRCALKRLGAAPGGPVGHSALRWAGGFTRQPTNRSARKPGTSGRSVSVGKRSPPGATLSIAARGHFERREPSRR